MNISLIFYKINAIILFSLLFSPSDIKKQALTPLLAMLPEAAISLLHHLNGGINAVPPAGVADLQLFRLPFNDVPAEQVPTTHSVKPTCLSDCKAFDQATAPI